ncbi:lipoate synthase [Candidatus Methanoperedens nitroreducens]|uniref:Lipoyl synthase n=1 Tax=Candidatus Methanoperedens nitratireducens TaxID=1392998 RepID=A0A062V6N6_9EURY|nr:lipoyl synthase [Candidatus Methanoperedens nitroreducens]KCZ71419.1 lipoate synthase [Candidatus Methanoperedens nitroreducens]MDJ1421045.1 lipoyl synthase [Candidatus Methanoperedens sp.]
MVKPEWLKTRPPAGIKFLDLKRTMHEHGLNTVCTGARCPNVGECWSRGTAAFMIMGSTCTRSCRFCAVKKGRCGEPLDPSEPERIARAVREADLRYAVLTSVDRDDLPDGGAGHFADCIRAIKDMNNNILVEILIPDFQGDIQCLRRVIDAHPDVVGHNIETVEELQAMARDRRAGYRLSMEVLLNLKQMSSSTRTKSSIMLGLGETEDMVLKTMDDLRNARVDIITLGQYLRPTVKQLEVKEYLTQEKFEFYKRKAEDMGFPLVISGPLVRSSYMAEELLDGLGLC